MGGIKIVLYIFGDEIVLYRESRQIRQSITKYKRHREDPRCLFFYIKSIRLRVTLLYEERYEKKCNNVQDFDHRVDGGASGIFVGVAYGVAGDRSFVGVRALAAVETVFNGLLGVIPGAAAGGHGNSQEQPGDDGADEHAAQGHS